MFIIYKQTYLLCVNTIFIPNFDSNFIQSQMVDLKLMVGGFSHNSSHSKRQRTSNENQR